MISALLLAHVVTASAPADELIEIRYVVKEVQALAQPFWLDGYRPKIVTMTVVEEASAGVGYRKVSKYDDIVETLVLFDGKLSGTGIKDGVKIHDQQPWEVPADLVKNIGASVYEGGPSPKFRGTVTRKTDNKRVINGVPCWLEIEEEPTIASIVSEEEESHFFENWSWWPEDEQLQKDIGPMEFLRYEVEDGHADLIAYEKIVKYKVSTRKVSSDWPLKAELPVSSFDSIDESLALAIARNAVDRNDKWLDRAEFVVRRDGSGWSVLVTRLPAVPGGHRGISINSKGKVTRYARGR